MDNPGVVIRKYDLVAWRVLPSLANPVPQRILSVKRAIRSNQ